MKTPRAGADIRGDNGSLRPGPTRIKSQEKSEEQHKGAAGPKKELPGVELGASHEKIYPGGNGPL